MRRLLAITLVALLVPAASSQAKVSIIDKDSNVVDTISKLGCRASGKKGKQDFFATGKSDEGKFRLGVFIDEPVFTGFGEEYTIYFGGTDPQYFLTRRSDEEEFSNFKLPGTPAGTLAAGEIKFNGKGTKMGIGTYAANNKSMTEGYAFAGVVKCKYRRR